MKLMTFQIPGDGEGIAQTELGQLAEYYQMCRRYGLDYFEESPGNTVYHLVLENQNLLFTFCRKKNQYTIRYLAFGRNQVEEAWITVMDLVRHIHRETCRSRGRVTESDQYFEQNLKLLEKDVNRSLKPFSFIVSSLPEECFPQAKDVRLYNAWHTGPVKPEEMLVPLHAGDADARVLAEYDRMRKTLLRESRSAKTAEWELLRTSGGGKLSRRKSAQSVRNSGRSDALRMTAIEDAFSLLWEK